MTVEFLQVGRAYRGKMPRCIWGKWADRVIISIDNKKRTLVYTNPGRRNVSCKIPSFAEWAGVDVTELLKGDWAPFDGVLK